MKENNLTLWKPVVGYEDFYEVSDRGQVKNIADKKLQDIVDNTDFENFKITNPH